jgi:glycosyltransferase involved in cell wall biosynthesis
MNQTYQNVEVIVVDNHSMDLTRAIVHDYGLEPSLAGPERSSQVNFGVRLAKGGYVYRVDSDFVLDKDVIRQCVVHCETYGLHAIAVHNVSDPSVSFWSRVRKFDRDMHRGGEGNIAVRFVRREAWLHLGGLDESLIAGEDYDFHNRFVKAGYRFGFVESSELHLGEPRTLKEVVIKHYSYGKTILGFAKKDPIIASRQLSPLRIGYIRNLSQFNDPTMIMGLIVYQLVRYLATLAGIGASIELEQQSLQAKAHAVL